MFLQIEADKYRETWVAFIIQGDRDNRVLDVGVSRFTRLTELMGVNIPFTGLMTITVIASDVDRLKVANRLNEYLTKNGQTNMTARLEQIVMSWQNDGRKDGCPVICNETNKTWPSITACASENKISYSQLLKHLNADIGYRTVRGHTYRRV